jgi:acyl carrier protein
MVMTEQEIFCCLADIVEKVAGVAASKVTYEADITDDLGISSLSLVEIIVAAEDTFSVEIPDAALRDLRTVQDFVGYVQRVKHLGEGSSVPEDSASEVAAT